MESGVRECPPSALRIWMHHLRDQAELSVNKLANLLCIKFPKSRVNEIVQQAVHDGILVAGAKPKHLRFPTDINSIPISSHDYYCYECHNPGTLVKCINCARAFHRHCYRRKPERPNYPKPSEKKNKRPAFSSDTDTDHQDDLNSTNMTTRSNRSPSVIFIEEQEALSDTLNRSDNSEGTTMRPIKYSLDDGKLPMGNLLNDSKPEVIFVAEVPPPLRRRHRLNTCKSESTQIVEEVNDQINETELCTACRLLRTAELNNPPSVGTEELSYLMKCSFEAYSSWMETDCVKYMEESEWSVKDMQLIKRLLFKCNDIGMDGIYENIQLNKYAFLTNFHIDLLDFQHNICVFFGVDTNAAESTKWLLRDIVHELDEIRRCPDCYRYSVEKPKFWFARPCVQRHELVYAKARGFQFWPAKVVRVLPKHNKYDVRFFGNEHSRALIAAHNIVPIDTDEVSLKLRKSAKLKDALQELQCFQALSAYPPSYFGFYADREMTNSVIQSALRSFILSEYDDDGGGYNELSETPTVAVTTEASIYGRNNGQSRTVTITQTHTPTSMSNTPLTATMSPIEMPVNRKRRRITTTTPNKKKGQNSKRSTASPPQSRITRSTEAARRLTWEKYKTLLHDYECAKRDLASAKRVIEKQILSLRKLKDQELLNEVEKKRIKRKQWCFWCLKEANYHCCFKASYCSRDCQQRDLREGHAKICNKKGSAVEHSST